MLLLLFSLTAQAPAGPILPTPVHPVVPVLKPQVNKGVHGELSPTQVQSLRGLLHDPSISVFTRLTPRKGVFDPAVVELGKFSETKILQGKPIWPFVVVGPSGEIVSAEKVLPAQK